MLNHTADRHNAPNAINASGDDFHRIVGRVPKFCEREDALAAARRRRHRYQGAVLAFTDNTPSPVRRSSVAEIGTRRWAIE